MKKKDGEGERGELGAGRCRVVTVTVVKDWGVEWGGRWWWEHVSVLWYEDEAEWFERFGWKEIHRLMCRKTWSTLLIQFSSNSKRKYNSSSFLNDDVICSFLLGLWFMNFLLIWNFDLCFWFEYEMVFKILNSIWNYCLDFDLNMRLDLVFAIWRAYFGVVRALDFNFFSL